MAEKEPQRVATGLERDDELASDNPERDSHSPFYSKWDQSPEESANLFSRIAFAWLDPLIFYGRKTPIQSKDAYPLPSEIRANRICEQTFLREWDKEVEWARAKSKEPSLVAALWRSFRGTWLKGSVCRFTGDLSQVISPILLQRLISYLSTAYAFYFIGPSSPDEPAPNNGIGFGYAAGMLGLQLLNTVAINHFWSQSQKTGLQVRTSLVAAVFQKCLRLSQG